ncbi:hypothetical protein IV40_GL001510 [Lactobacillus selangorensis]|nr:hypothetical protein IV40_GL001510 [Lactobacillus selangorensis]
MISFLWQGGKCRHCRQRLTPLFLIGECLGGVAGLLIYRLPLVQQPLAGILSACLFFCAAMDCFENCLMPLWLLPFGAAAFCCAAHLYWLSAGAVTVLLYGLHCWHNGLGLGDVELILLLALFLTPSQIWFLLFAACCFALLGFLFLKTKQQQPFVPYLLLGYLITLIYF